MTEVDTIDFTHERESVARRVDARRDGEIVRLNTMILRHQWGSSARVNENGGVLEDLQLVGSDAELHDILYFGNTNDVDRGISHIMSPAGSYDGLGGQHGPGRWLDWHTFRLNSITGREKVAFQAKREDDGETLGRYIELGGDFATIESSVQASIDELNTSIGEHFYFAASGELDETMINGLSLQYITKDNEAIQKLESGKALSVAMDNSGLWDIKLPGGLQLELKPRLYDSDYKLDRFSDVPAELWIWRREGAKGYICIEPAFGVEHSSDGFRNDLLELQPGEEAKLQTTLRVIS